VLFLQVGFQVSQRRACGVIGLNRSTLHYQNSAKDQTALRMRLRDLAATRVRYGYCRFHVLLQGEGWQVNHKWVYRLCRQEGLSLRLKYRKKRTSSLRVLTPAAQTLNKHWNKDFMTDSFTQGCPTDGAFAS
jgi:putative transposase